MTMLVNSVVSKPVKTILSPVRVFQNPLQLSWLERNAYPISDFFITAQKRAEDGLTHWAKQAPTGLKWLPKALKSFIATSHILDYDYQKVSEVPSLGRIITQIPKGPYLITALGVTVGSRLWHAYHRKMFDKNEPRDILIRDLPTFIAFGYMLKPATTLSAWALEKWRGIQMLEYKTRALQQSRLSFKKVIGSIFRGEIRFLEYPELINAYRVSDANRLAAILSNPQNYKGLRRVMAQVQANPYLSPHAKGLMRQFREAMEAGMKNGPQQMDVLKASAQKAFGFLDQLETSRLQTVGEQTRKAAGNARYFKSLFSNAKSHIPSFTEMFSSYARATRGMIDSAAFLSVIVLIGFGLVEMNKWITRHWGFKHPTPPAAPAQPNPFQYGMAPPMQPYGQRG